MNQTYIECLMSMGEKVDCVDGLWYLNDRFVTENEICKEALEKLSKREDAMKRVVAFLVEEYPNRYYCLEKDAIRILNPFGGDGPRFLEFGTAIELAIELNITAQELLGVEG